MFFNKKLLFLQSSNMLCSVRRSNIFVMYMKGGNMVMSQNITSGCKR
uniref:Uncharacterized protein n=1 Tax=Arundo donax TaxID=35708 RepID=A0A0A9BU77_ARUDO